MAAPGIGNPSDACCDIEVALSGLNIARKRVLWFALCVVLFRARNLLPHRLRHPLRPGVTPTM